MVVVLGNRIFIGGGSVGFVLFDAGVLNIGV